MNAVKRALTLLLTLLLALAVSTPALAEGFTYGWDMDDDNLNGPHCKALLLYNLDTDSVVYAMEPDERLSMASMTKIMTYIVAYENIPDVDNTLITVPESVDRELEGTWSSTAEIYAGEQYTAEQLLYLMMIPSGNNAALCLAKYVDAQRGDPEVGEDFDPESADYTGISSFVELMNQKAAELGCSNTHFTNPHGLHNENHYASARDMVKIARYAMGLPGFTEITGTTAYDYSPRNFPEYERTAHTTNRMLLNFADDGGMNYYYQSATGVKTGSHDEAGFCITATAFGYTYIAVAMGSPYDGNVHGEMLDARSLFRWAFGNLEKKTVAVQGQLTASVDLKYAWRKDTLQLAAGENVAVMLPGTVADSSILYEPDLPEFVEAPIRKGEQIGTAKITYAGEVIGNVTLVASESVAKSEALEVWEQGQAVLRAPWFLVIMAVIVALIIVYIILIFLYRRKQRQLRRVKRFRDM